MNVITRALRWLRAAETTSSAIAYTLVSRVAILFINVATGVIIARTLGPAGRGAASAIDLWPLVMCGLLTLGVPVALRYEVRQKREDPEGLFSVALVISAGLGLVAMGAGMLFIPHWLSHYPATVIEFGQIVMCFAPLIMLNGALQAFYEARGNFNLSNQMMYVPPAMTVVFLLTLYALHALTPYSVVLAYQVPCAFVTVMMIYKLRRSIGRPSHFVRQSRLLLHYGSRAYGLDVLNTLSAQIGQVVVIGLLSASSFGLYAVALSISRTLSTLAASLNTVIFPKASGMEAAGAVGLVSRSARLIFASTTLASVVFIPALPFLIRLAYGKAYLPVVAIATVLTIEAVLGATTMTFTQAFMATGRPGLVTALQLIGLCTTFPLMLELIPRFGLIGAAYALLASTALRLLLVLVSYPLFLRHRMPPLLMTGQDMRDIRARFQRAFA